MPGKIVLVGEPMGLFIAKEEGELSEVKNFSASIAGAEYNVAVGLTRLGHEVSYCTKLGNDPMADRILGGMKENHISTDLILRDDEKLTGFMMKGKTAVGDPKIAYFRKGSAASCISTHDIDKLDLCECEFLHVTGVFPAVSPSACNAVKRLIKRCKDLDMIISFDPNLRPQLWPGEQEMIRTLNSFAESADTVLPGIAEGKILTGRDTPEGIAEFYHKKGVTNVVVKLGSSGAFYSGPNGSGTVPGFKVNKVVDTVGAGDGFAAGVVSALAEGLSLKDAVKRGTVIGAIQVTNVGDNEGLPTREELEAIMEKGEC
ncbi:MAG: sugar kinase [Clostridia bacterium]|nr:sugar kinase [Clostridia bacterium]